MGNVCGFEIRGTVVDFEDFDCDADCEALHEAFHSKFASCLFFNTRKRENRRPRGWYHRDPLQPFQRSATWNCRKLQRTLWRGHVRSTGQNPTKGSPTIDEGTCQKPGWICRKTIAKGDERSWNWWINAHRNHLHQNKRATRDDQGNIHGNIWPRSRRRCLSRDSRRFQGKV